MADKTTYIGSRGERLIECAAENDADVIADIKRRRAFRGHVRCPRCKTGFMDFVVNRQTGAITAKCATKNCVSI